MVTYDFALMATEKRDYYEVLGVGRTVTDEEIKRAYRKLAVKFHPDKNPDDPHAEEKFKELGEAYDVLMDPDKRAAYDRFGHAAFAQGGAGFGGGGFHDPFEIFREVFGGGGFGGGIFETFFGGGPGARSDDRRRGSDLRYDMEIKLEEAAFGAEKMIEIEKLDTCDKCHGSGAEPGSRKTSCPTCAGRGQVISSRGFFHISQTCPRCHGAGEIIEKPCQKCRGEGRVEKLSRIKLKIPAGIREGTRLRSPGNGEAGIGGGAAGDLYVVVHIKEHNIFHREADDLYCDVPIPFSVAALGGEVDVPTAVARFRQLRAALPSTAVHYAVKANPAPEVLSLLASMGSCFDCASVAEIEMALAAGASPERVSYGNTIKKERDIARAFEQTRSTISRLGGNEAGLRNKLDAMFVNLSHRGQSLVEFAMALGPAGEIIRLAGKEGEARKTHVVAALRDTPDAGDD